MSSDGTIVVEVEYYAEVRELAGQKRERIELPLGSSTDNLVSAAVGVHPSLDRMSKNLRVIVNGNMVNVSSPLREGDVVALVPPLCGG